MRTDVQKFSEMMSATMDRKQIERKELQKPHYMEDSYHTSEAFMDMQVLQRKLEHAIEAHDAAFVRQVLVHIANYCMIVDARIEKGKW